MSKNDSIWTRDGVSEAPARANRTVSASRCSHAKSGQIHIQQLNNLLGNADGFGLITNILL